MIAAALRDARVAASERPRHVLLIALVAGLLTGPVSLWATGAATAGAAAVPLAPPLAMGAGAAVVAGAVTARVRQQAVDSGPLLGLHGRWLSGRATVLEPPRRRARGASVVRVRLLDGPARGDVAVLRASRPVRWPVVGGEVAYRGTAGPVIGAEAWQKPRGAHAIIDARSVNATGRRRGGLAGALDGVRERGREALSGGVPATEAALVRGMVLGDDAGVPDDTRDAFERTSLAHLLAVSGQNVVLLATLVIAAATALGAGLRARLTAALVCVLLYVPLTGAGASIQRAGVMGAAGLLAGLAGRPASRWYAVALAAAVTLAWNPYAPRDVGWQLSFAAVLALLVGVPPLRAALRARRVPGLAADAFAVTLAATLGTAPLLALQFDQVSTVSIPANLLVAPAVAPLMWLGMLAAAVGQVSQDVAAPLAQLAGVLAGFVRAVAEWMAAWPRASVTPGPALTVAVCVAAPTALLAVTVGQERLREGWRRLARGDRAAAPSPGDDRVTRLRRTAALAAALVVAGAVGALPLLGRAAAPPAPGELVVAFLDIGQGDATLIRSARASVLVDTGPPDGPVLRRLDEEGVNRLDLLILTHAQADHEGAALDVVRELRPRLILNGGDGRRSPVQDALPAAAAAVGARVLDARAGQILSLPGLRTHVLWPPPAPGPAGEDPNDRAVVAHVRAGAFDLLLPADAEAGVTATLPLPEVEALKVAHHGSEDPALGAMLDRVRPSVAVIPVGRGNTYGHPAAPTLAALRAVPTVLRTDRDGTVRLRVSDGRIRIERDGAQR